MIHTPERYEFTELAITIWSNPYSIVAPFTLVDLETGKQFSICTDFLDLDEARIYAKAHREQINKSKPDWWNYW